MIATRLHLFVMALAVLAAITLSPAQAQLSALPANVQAALTAPGANVGAVALATAESNPALATAVLQAAIDILGPGSLATANLLNAFAAAAQGDTTGANPNYAVAAALANALNNVINNPANAGLDPTAVANARATIVSVVSNPNVQAAILAGAPGTGGQAELQTAVNGYNSETSSTFGNFGSSSTTGGGGSQTN